MLFLVLFGKDLASIPYVFGNTPLTYLLWMSIGFAFYQPEPTCKINK